MSCLNCSCNKCARISVQALNNRIASIKENNSFSGLMIIGESPTALEASRGMLMTGAGAQVLKDTLAKVGLPYKEEEVYYTTALKCAIPKKKGQKMPTDVTSNCREVLLNEVDQIKPRLILVCGATALYTLIGDGKLKITELYGRVMEQKINGAQILPIMNPGVLIHKAGDYKPFLSYLQLAATIFNGDKVEELPETEYRVLNTQAECLALWKKMQVDFRSGKFNVAAYDIETTGLDYRIVDFLVLGICYEPSITYVIPREQMDIAHNFLEGIPWKCIWQHGKYDKKVMWRRNLGKVNIDEDTIYQHYVLDETSAHDLGYLSKVYLNAKEYKYKMNQNWNSVELETYPSFKEALCERVAVDCDYTLRLYHKFDSILSEPENNKLQNLYKNLLLPAANFLSRVEQNGILIYPPYLNELDKKYVKLLEEISTEILALSYPLWDAKAYQEQTGAKSAPVSFNPGSSQQMSWMVFDRLKLKPRIKKGKGTDKDVLNSIENAPPLIKKVLEYRTVQKEHATYVLGLLNARDEDGRVRTTFSLHIAATGRLTSKEPNVQNQPSANGVGNIRRAFIPKKGYVFAEIDYSGAELRWLAFLSNCPVLSEVFIDGRNLHVETATALFGPNFSKIQKMRAKAVNFGIPYGREAQSLADEFNISKDEAQKMIDDWLGNYHGAKEYLQWCADQVVLGNYIETPWGRRRRFGLVNPATLHSLQNEAKNFPIQSASSDLLLYCAMEVEKELLEKYDTRILNLIHDSMLLEIPADPKIIKEVAKYVNNIMVEMPIRLFQCPIPFKTDFEIGFNWWDLVTFNYTDIAEQEDKQIQWEDHNGTDMEVSWLQWIEQEKLAERIKDVNS